LRGFLVFPEGFDAARIRLAWKDYPTVAEGYVLRENVEPIEFAEEAEEEDAADPEAGGRETRDAPEPEPEMEPDDHREPVRDSSADEDEPAQLGSQDSGANAPVASSLSRAMSYRPGAPDAEPSATQRGDETAPRSPMNVKPHAKGKQVSQTARELSEALEPQRSVERSAGGPGEAQLPGLDADDDLGF
jgi:hypothetical protein